MTYKHILPALALLAATAMPALAAENDPVADNLQAQWMASATATENVRRALAAMLQERTAMQARITALEGQCGDKCKPPTPEAKAEPVQPVPPPQSEPTTK